MNFKEFITKLQSLSEHQKKIVLWTIVVVLAVIMGFFWVRGTMDTLSRIGGEIGKIEMPKIDVSDMPKLPNLDVLQTTTPTNK